MSNEMTKNFMDRNRPKTPQRDEASHTFHTWQSMHQHTHAQTHVNTLRNIQTVPQPV